MKERISVSRAIWRGTLLVNGPVFILLIGPGAIFVQLQEVGAIPKTLGWLFIPIFLASFIVAWLWWSLSIPKWRLWAYERVDNVSALKARAVEVGLTWPDNHAFGKTEIKSKAHAARERQLDSEAEQ